MQSLAEFLGTALATAEGGVIPRSPEKLTAAEFAEAVVNSPEFRSFIVNSLVLGDLAPQIIMRLMDYAPNWGKPVERVEVRDTTELSQLTEEQLEDRALQLADLARQMRRTREAANPGPESIH